MARKSVITHAYRVPGGWERVKRQRLTRESAAELKTQGFTMARARHGVFHVREVSLSWYTA